jgi:hypothetical protein
LIATSVPDAVLACPRLVPSLAPGRGARTKTLAVVALGFDLLGDGPRDVRDAA